MDTLTQDVFGSRVRTAAERAGLTAARIMVAFEDKGKARDPRTIERWMAGLNMPRPDDIVTLAEILGVTVDFLFGNDANGKAE